VHTSIKQGKPRNRPTGVDLFCGVGGMSLGFEQAGFDVVAAVDFEPRHVETHSKNFPTCETVCADLSAISGAELRSKTGIGDSHIDVVFAGPPCQGFSLIGKRLKNDPRNLLLFDLARLIGELSPSYFAVENVEGILLGDAKNVLADFVGRLKKSGYCIVEPVQVLDAAEFGVPQLRRRVLSWVIKAASRHLRIQSGYSLQMAMETTTVQQFGMQSVTCRESRNTNTFSRAMYTAAG